MLIFLILIFQKYNIMITEDKKKMQLKQAKKNVNQKKKKNSVFLFFHQVTSPSNSSHLPRYMYLYSLVFQLLL